MVILTQFQRQVLAAIGLSPLRDSFYLTGGTALSAFYLHHRYSVDLDFFTPDPTAVPRVPPMMQDIARQLEARVSFTRTLGSFLECFLENAAGNRVQMDFAQDTPYRLRPTRREEDLGIQIDSLTDIACNKLSALFERGEPKDFVDVYFICQEVMPFEQLVTQAREKHLGLDTYWLAVALRRVEDVEMLPRMIKPLSQDEMKLFFLERAKKLMADVE